MTDPPTGDPPLEPGLPIPPIRTVRPDAADALGWDGPEPEEPTDAELLGQWPDPFAGPPEGADAWLADLSEPELDDLAARWAADHPAAAPDALAAGFARDLPGDSPFGFAAGGPLDQLPPDPVLAGLAEDTYLAGLGALPDDELVGLLAATRRLSSWQAAMEFAAVAELAARRQSQTSRPGSSRAAEHVSDELAAALTLTGRSADSLLTLACDLRRLPEVMASLFAGRIDRARAAVFAQELAVLDLTQAAAIAAALIRSAERMTTGQLRAAVRRMVLAFDPEAARHRADKGRSQARVEAWQEGSGNGALAGRELPTAEVIAADQRITAIAQALKDAGAAGDLDQLRSAVFTALLTGRDPATLGPANGRAASHGTDGLTGGDPGQPGSAYAWTAGMIGSINLTVPLSTWLGLSDAPGQAGAFGSVDAATCRDIAGRLASGPDAQWCLTITDAHGRAIGHACARAGPKPPGAPRPRRSQPTSTGPPTRARPTAATPPATTASPATGTPATGTPVTGTPPTTGASTADSRSGTGDAGPSQWLASLKVRWLEHGICAHTRRVQGYRPGRALSHLVQIRQRTCAFPGCRRPAQRCDTDHTVAYEQGGPTCECNLAALCRRHHRAKQAPGWQLSQPEPGILVWTTPHGRSYVVEPDNYPV